MKSFLAFSDDDFGLSEDESIHEDGICFRTVLSTDREVLPDTPSGKSASTGGNAMNMRECSSDEECFDSELSYSLVCSLYVEHDKQKQF